MALTAGEEPGPTRLGGLEQFGMRGTTDGVSYCVAGAKPYALEFGNDDDVICLLLGDINSRTKFEDDSERPLVFLGESTAYHPRGGNLRVRANDVRHGFIAFSYAGEFQGLLDDRNVSHKRRAGSRNNIRDKAIKFLALYVRERLRSAVDLQPLELQFLASSVYIETMRRLDSQFEARRTELSDAEFKTLCDFIDEKLDGKITCSGLARAVNLPLRTVFDGVKSRTGRSPYSLVIEKRIERARTMLTQSDASIAEVACACGFSSQQHMTSVLSRRLGQTPRRLRLGR